MSKTEDIIKKLKDSYSGYEEFAGSEMKRIEYFEEEMNRAKDPAWIAFRENPITQRLYRGAAASYKTARMTLANDNGTLSQIDRMRLDLSATWALWYIKSLGGDPANVQRQVEDEIERFAVSAGISI